ncbi:hypothetical protein K438DRAFT_1782717 [Mycena galopus ATCC 62051]|nr:hypothetical protein K438DRAFT_1782717 [Mycena galopus ATCC 62051]
MHFLRSSLTGELTGSGSGFVEFLSIERVTQALTKVGDSVIPYGAINHEYARSREGYTQNHHMYLDLRMYWNEPTAHCTAHVMPISSWVRKTEIRSRRRTRCICNSTGQNAGRYRQIHAGENGPPPPRPRAGVVAAAPGYKGRRRPRESESDLESEGQGQSE